MICCSCTGRSVARSYRPLIPAALELDTFDGWAWLGVVPFRMTGVRPHYLPAFPSLSAFPEINVRTYVTTPGRSGVWFFSLDAASWLAVRGARLWYGLPYYDARMRVIQQGETVHYHSTRTHRHTPAETFDASYTPMCGLSHPVPARWSTGSRRATVCTQIDRLGHVGYGDIHHAPWPLQAATAEVKSNTMAMPLHIDLPRTQPVLHFSPLSRGGGMECGTTGYVGMGGDRASIPGSALRERRWFFSATGGLQSLYIRAGQRQGIQVLRFEEFMHHRLGIIDMHQSQSMSEFMSQDKGEIGDVLILNGH